MTVKMYQIINFGTFYNEVCNTKIPLKLAFKLSNLTKAIDEKTAFYHEKLQEILKEYAEFDANGNVIPTDGGRGIKVKPGMEMECMAKVNELQSLDVDLPDITFDVEEFGNIELTLEVFNIITPFLKN